MLTWIPLSGVLALGLAGARVLWTRRAQEHAGVLLTLQPGGVSDDALSFTVGVSSRGGRAAQGVAVRAAVGAEIVAELPPFDLAADAYHAVQVDVPRPRLGTLVPECGNQPTLYGEPLVVTATGAGAQASAEWHEQPIVEAADPIRYAAMQRAWASAGKGAGQKSF